MDDNPEGEGIWLLRDVIGRILSRCPAKTIGQMRTKSSLILSSTSSQYFIQQHLLFAKSDISQYGLLVIYVYDGGSRGSSPGSPCGSSPGSPCGSSSGSQPDEDAEIKLIVSFSLSSFLDKEFSCLAMKNPFPNERWTLVSNVNGICCLNRNDDDHLILWNPTVGVVRRTSSWNHLVDCSIRWYTTQYGFGFLELMNEYVGMALYMPNEIEFLAFIYEASTNSWQSFPSFRGLGDFVVEKMIRTNFDIVFVAGKFYWVVKMVETEESIGMEYIVSLDPVTKLYDILEKPSNEPIRYSYLGEMGTCLCWCVLYEDDFLKWEVWMWEDYTWSFAFHLPFSQLMIYLKPMFKLPDGQLLFECNGGLVCCDVNNDTHRVVEFPEIPHRLLISPQIYLETMVSPANIVAAGAGLF